MKKLFTIYIFIVLAAKGYSQFNCQASFSYQFDSINQALNLHDISYNTDSTPINELSRAWDVRFYSDTSLISNVTDTSKNPVIPLPSGFAGKVVIEFYIQTINSCNSFDYDSLYVNITPSVICRAAFSYSWDSITHRLSLFDHSVNSDSTPINVLTWQWEIHYNGAWTGSATQNPVFQLYPTSTYAYVCLTISSLNFCSSIYCDTLYFAPTLLDTCVTSFSYQMDTLLNTVSFHDNSYTNNGQINFWYWVVTKNGVSQFSSNLQNPVFNYQTHGYFNVCLNTITDGGCSSQHCSQLIILDSSNSSNCQLNVSAMVNHVSVINGNDGSIDLTVTGGLPSYIYAWNNGDTIQDISNLSSGIYTVSISSQDCPAYTYSYTILEPYDTLNIVVDTLYTNIIDTCFNFVVDSFYVASINVQGHDVIVEWVLIGGVDSSTLLITYQYSNSGAQVVVLTANCNGSKDLTTYITYIYISQFYNIPENADANQIKLFPNPVSDILNITFYNLNKKPVLLRIFSSIGQQIFFKSVEANSDIVKINVSEFPSGLYYIQIDNGSGKGYVKKFIK